MTFEEFFNKKRIDLGLMRDADPALYSEFKSHFESMGEKSFDHTKKFWFNKLRHLYHLAEPVKKAVTQLETQIASQAEPLSSPTMEQSLPAPQPDATQEVTPAASAKPKPGFRPRSIPPAAAQAPAKPAQEAADTPVDKPATPVSKPGFRPRNVKPVSGGLSEDTQNTTSRPGQDIPSGASQGNTENTPRPAYKPRFNAGKLAEKPAEGPGDKKEEQEGSPSLPQEAGSGKASASPAEEPKPAYKPRFNLKTTTKKEVQEDNSEVKGPSADSQVTDEHARPVIKADNETAKPADSGESTAGSQESSPEAPEQAAKPAYKPRFNVKNIKPKE